MSEILMPRLSDTMEEGVVSSWQKKPGDAVAVGDVIVDIETDKAVMEYEAYEAGVLEKILVNEGETAAIGAPIAVLAPVGAPAGTGGSAPEGGAPAAAAAPAAEPVRGQAPAAEPVTVDAPAKAAVNAPADGAEAAGTDRPASRPPSSPLARRLARENGIDLATLSGSGPGGRVVRADVEAAARAAGPAPSGARTEASAEVRSEAPAVRPEAPREDPDTELVPLNRFRKVTARRLAESMRTAPHIYLTRTIDVEALIAFRATLNTALAPAKVSVNDLIVKACATALREHPELNVSFTEEHLLVHKRVNVGVAVSIDDGLLVPVIRDADRKSVSQISAETRELAGRAREKRLTAQEMSGGTFSVSNMGMMGVEHFTAVINPPEAAILAVGAIRDEAVVRDGALVPGKRMTVTLSVDHRACDGATGAAFLDGLAGLLENPLRIVA